MSSTETYPSLLLTKANAFWPYSLPYPWWVAALLPLQPVIVSLEDLLQDERKSNKTLSVWIQVVGTYSTDQTHRSTIE